MAMNGRQGEAALAARLERPHWKNHGERFDHENPAYKKKKDFLLDDDGDYAQGPAERERNHIPHENLRGMRVVPKKTQRRADKRTAEHRQLANLGDGLNVQVGGPAEVAAHVGHYRRGARGYNRAADGEAVQPGREVHGVPRADNYKAHEKEEGNKPKTPSSL